MLMNVYMHAGLNLNLLQQISYYTNNIQIIYLCLHKFTYIKLHKFINVHSVEVQLVKYPIN